MNLERASTNMHESQSEYPVLKSLTNQGDFELLQKACSPHELGQYEEQMKHWRPLDLKNIVESARKRLQEGPSS